MEDFLPKYFPSDCFTISRYMTRKLKLQQAKARRMFPRDFYGRRTQRLYAMDGNRLHFLSVRTLNYRG